MAKTTSKESAAAKTANDKAAQRNPNDLVVAWEKGKTQERQRAELGLSPVTGNAQTSRAFAKPTFGELDLTESVGVLHDAAKAVQDGSLKGLEATLTAQAIALDKIFCELARRAAANMGEYLDATDKFMRLALRAQNQCRATIQTLGELKNPPVVYARQANIASGPQQVNNGQGFASSTRAGAHAGEYQNLPNELLEVKANERLDTRAPGAASGINSDVAAVG